MDTEPQDILDGAEGQPAPPPSTSQPEPSTPKPDATESLSERLKRLEGMVSSLQSGRDKAKDRLEKDVEGVKEQIARIATLAQSGLDTDQIARELVIDDLVKSRYEGEPSPVSPPALAGTQPQATGAEEGIDPTVFGLDANDPDVVELLRARKVNPENLYALAKRKRDKQPPPASPASVLPTGGGGSAGPSADMASLTEKLQKLLANPTTNREEIKKVREQLQGLVPK